MINDFFKKFLTNNHIMDDYGLKYNYNYDYEVNKITNEEIKGPENIMNYIVNPSRPKFN